MFSTSRVGRIISFIIFILGAVGILFIPFIDIRFKISFIVVFFLIIQVVTYINYRKTFAKYIELYNNCDLKKLIKELEKKYKENDKSKRKLLFELYLFISYYYVHECNKIKPFVNKIETEYSNMKNSINKISYNNCLIDYYWRVNNIDKLKELYNEMKILLQTINLDYNVNVKQQYLSNYYGTNYRIALCNDKIDKNTLQEAEKYYLKRFNNESLLVKVSSANQLITIYEKLSNDKKAKEYADFVIKNHKDYYIDPERISKYSK